MSPPRPRTARPPHPTPHLTRWHRRWLAVTATLWALPLAIVALGVGLAALLVELTPALSADLLARHPRLLGAGADGARGMLSTIAGSMITVAGVTFSITIAAVAQMSAQYTPRVLRTFMRDRANQAVLGAFVGIFAYCLVVLRTIRGGDEGAFVPAAAVLGGFLLALVGVGVLVYFIVHITESLQAASILDRVRRETETAVDRLFPEDHAAPGHGAAGAAARLADVAWQPVAACRSGYIEAVDDEALLAVARERGVVVRMLLGIGDFAVAGAPLAAVAPGGADDSDAARALDACYTVGPYRTVTQDPAFGVQQIVDIALKALSPGVNDTTTAVTCVGHLSAVLARVARRRLPDPAWADAGGTVRVLAAGPTFEGLVATALDDVRRSAAGNVTVLGRLLDAIEAVGRCTADQERRNVLAQHAARAAEAAAREVAAPEDRAAVARRAEAVRASLAPAPRSSPGHPPGGMSRARPPG